jgi:hypothetical protein
VRRFSFDLYGLTPGVPAALTFTAVSPNDAIEVARASTKFMDCMSTGLYPLSSRCKNPELRMSAMGQKRTLDRRLVYLSPGPLASLAEGQKSGGASGHTRGGGGLGEITEC